MAWIRRAVTCFTDADTGNLMTEISRVRVRVKQKFDQEWQEPNGTLFHLGYGVYEYVASDDEDCRNCPTFFVQFDGIGTQEGVRDVAASKWNPDHSDDRVPVANC